MTGTSSFLGYIDESSSIINCRAEKTAKVYKNCSLINCSLEYGVSIGDYSRLEDSALSEKVNIQRYNMIMRSSIGRYSYTGTNTTIQNSIIGKFCSISWNANIGGASHDYRKLTNHAFLYDDSFGIKPPDEGYDPWERPCIIGNDVWIAANASINRGVRVGNGAVIGAGAVVTKDVEPYCIVGGVPARPLRLRFSSEIIDVLMQANWWDLPAKVITNNFQLFNSFPSEEVLYKIMSLCRKYRVCI